MLDRRGLEPVVEQTGARLAVGRHVLVVGDAAAPYLYEMALIGDLAVDEVVRLDGRAVHGRVLILAPSTQDEFETWSGDGHADAWGITRVPGWKGGHSWITLDLAQPGVAAATMKDDRSLLHHVIAHELFHALTLPPGGPERAPLWLVEGFAEVAGQRMRELVPSTSPHRVSLPPDARFEVSQDAYFRAWQFAEFLMRHEGRARAMLGAGVRPTRPHRLMTAAGDRGRCWLASSAATAPRGAGRPTRVRGSRR